MRKVHQQKLYHVMTGSSKGGRLWPREGGSEVIVGGAETAAHAASCRDGGWEGGGHAHSLPLGLHGLRQGHRSSAGVMSQYCNMYSP